MEAIKEGWTWLFNARKWHYFRNGESLCRKWMIWNSGDLELENDDSPDNCATCRKKLKKIKNEDKLRL